MIKYISALTLALFSLSAAAQNASVSEAQPVSQPHELQHVLVAQAAVEVEQETVETNAPGAAAGGVGANQLEAPVAVGEIGRASCRESVRDAQEGRRLQEHRAG